MSSNLTKWMADQDPRNLSCRDLGHNWVTLTARRIKGGFERDLVCHSCETTKTQVLDTKGYVVKVRQHYDKTYLRPKGLGRVTSAEKATIRLHNIKES